ncbi:MAG: hypothetical protein WC238_01110 [Parcubacteria group bacterium]|jgi:hypothetical protein
MAKYKQNLEINKKLTLVGRFVHWADGVEVNGKVLKLSVLIWMAAFAIGQQKTNWQILRGEKVVRAESELPQLAPAKEVMQNNNLQCGEKAVAKTFAIGKLSLDQFTIKKNMENIIADKPMQQMIAAVSQRDTQTASYLVAIAKKESNLGKFSPKDADGKECFNYWGFRGSQNTTKSGYSCFASPEEAVAVVGDRIQYLTQIGKYDTPQKMSVWKCGFDCSWDNPAAVKKWITDVGYYHAKLTDNL